MACLNAEFVTAQFVIPVCSIYFSCNGSHFIIENVSFLWWLQNSPSISF